MIQRLGKTKYSIYAFDIESHNDEESIEKQETSMWLGCLINEDSTIDDENNYMYNMQEFLNKLEAISTPKRKHNEKKRPCKNICIYIYNLSFEWSFILPVILENGFTFKEKIEKSDEYSYNSVSTKTCSSVWDVQLKFHKNSGKIIFRDLSKIYGGGLGKVAKAFNLPTQKGEIDYRKNRLHDYIVTKEEKEYCFNDTRIIVDILLKIIEKGDKDFWNASSMATYSMKKMLKIGYRKAKKPYQKFREEYPELGREESEFLRKGVGGGITYAPPRWQFKDIKQKVLHIDAHQMHPSQAYMHVFPYGKGEYYTGIPLRGKICACRIRISYDYAKLHSVISLIGIDCIYDRELIVWDFEIPTMKKCYVNLKIEYIDGYAYNTKSLPWRKFYSSNYMERLKAKKNKDDFNTLYYKLLNNSSYGKLLEKPHNIVYENIVDRFGIINSNVIEKKEEEMEIGAKYTYLPVGSCIPAYSRVCLIELALKFGWEKIVYFDTDSIFVIYDEDTEKVWQGVDKRDFLNGWAMEEMIDRCQFTAPKRYKTLVDGKATIKSGGVNFSKYKADRIDDYIKENELDVTEEERKLLIEKYDLPYEEVNIISSTWQVQRAYRVKGGTIIEFQTKKMQVNDKYKNIYEKNVLNAII